MESLQEVDRELEVKCELLNAALCIAGEFEREEDTPEGVLEALEHIRTASKLVSNREVQDD